MPLLTKGKAPKQIDDISLFAAFTNFYHIQLKFLKYYRDKTREFEEEYGKISKAYIKKVIFAHLWTKNPSK